MGEAPGAGEEAPGPRASQVPGEALGEAPSAGEAPGADEAPGEAPLGQAPRDVG